MVVFQQYVWLWCIFSRLPHETKLPFSTFTPTPTATYALQNQVKLKQEMVLVMAVVSGRRERREVVVVVMTPPELEATTML